MLARKKSTIAKGATSRLVGCMIWGGTSLRYIHTTENETIRAVCAVSLLLVCIISTGTINYTHIHSFMCVTCVKKCLLMLAASGCTALHITVRSLLRALCVTNRSGRRVVWKSMFVCILGINLILVESVIVHLLMPRHWGCILGITQGRNRLLVTRVSSHSIGNVISFIIFWSNTVVKYSQFDCATCLRHVRNACWMETMHVQWVGNEDFQQKGHLEAHMHVNNRENSVTFYVSKCAFSDQNSLRRRCWHRRSCTERLVSCGLTFKWWIKSHLPFAGFMRSSPYSTRFWDKG
jgi:hypothetical protein